MHSPVLQTESRKKTRELNRTTFWKLMFTTWDPTLTYRASSREKKKNWRSDAYHTVFWVDVYCLKCLLQESTKCSNSRNLPHLISKKYLCIWSSCQNSNWWLCSVQLSLGQPVRWLFYIFQINCHFIYPQPRPKFFMCRLSTLLTSLWF